MINRCCATYKIMYTTKLIAEYKKKKHPVIKYGGNMNVYKCNWCKTWHIGRTNLSAKRLNYKKKKEKLIKKEYEHDFRYY